jgi:DNA-binding GntR family transcriptional regulator
MAPKDNLQPTAEPIYEALKAAITAGTLLPGEPLRQDDIARQHGVSKIPVREALLRLEVDGFVQFRKNKGATVREVSAGEILNLMDIRIALECRALELAIPQLAQSDLARARQALDDYDRAADAESWSALNIQFHTALYEPCGNEPLLQMIRDVRGRLGPAVRLLVTQTTGFERPQDEHRAILAACEAADVGAAVRLLRKHIETTRKETAARMRRQGMV